MQRGRSSKANAGNVTMRRQWGIVTGQTRRPQAASHELRALLWKDWPIIRVTPVTLQLDKATNMNMCSQRLVDLRDGSEVCGKEASVKAGPGLMVC